jgi:uncharacterized RDD family membrane protein YckC
MNAYPPQPPSGYGPPGGYPPQGEPGMPPPAYGQPVMSGAPGQAVPPYGQYQPPLPGQPGYQWGAAVPAYPFASFGQRFAAVLIDGLILSAIVTVPMIVAAVMILNGVDTYRNFDGTTSAEVTNGGLLAAGIVIAVVGVIVGLLYEPLLTARKGAHNGQTPGRQALKIRITNLQGGPIRTGQAWGRSLFRVCFSGSIFYLGYLWMLWDPMKQCWHDKVANTLELRA